MVKLVNIETVKQQILPLLSIEERIAVSGKIDQIPPVILDTIEPTADEVSTAAYLKGFISGCESSQRQLAEMTHMKCGPLYTDSVIYELQKPTASWVVTGGTTMHYSCSRCGGQGDFQDNFCRSCGAKIKSITNQPGV